MLNERRWEFSRLESVKKSEDILLLYVSEYDASIIDNGSLIHVENDTYRKQLSFSYYIFEFCSIWAIDRQISVRIALKSTGLDSGLFQSSFVQ